MPTNQFEYICYCYAEKSYDVNSHLAYVQEKNRN